MYVCAYSWCELVAYVCGHIHLSRYVLYVRQCVCWWVCVWAAHSGSWADLVSHAEGLWSTRPTDHRIVALNGPQIIKQATRIEGDAKADERSSLLDKQNYNLCSLSLLEGKE